MGGAMGGALARVGEAVSSAAPLLPLIIALPFIAAASYYLLVVNAPTPVVKERMAATASQLFTSFRDIYRQYLEPEHGAASETVDSFSPETFEINT